MELEIQEQKPIVNFRKDFYGTWQHHCYFIEICDENGKPYSYSGYEYFYADELDAFVKKYSDKGYDIHVTNLIAW
jgi:hypothetical protein